MSPQPLRLGPLEMETLGVFKDEGPRSVQEVQQILKKGGKELAYTTVMTVLLRLSEKGYLKRQKEGRGYVYFVPKSEARTRGRFFDKIRGSLFGGERLRPILALLEEGEELSTEELHELQKKVDEKLKKKGSRNDRK